MPADYREARLRLRWVALTQFTLGCLLLTAPKSRGSYTPSFPAIAASLSAARHNAKLVDVLSGVLGLSQCGSGSSNAFRKELFDALDLIRLCFGKKTNALRLQVKAVPPCIAVRYPGLHRTEPDFQGTIPIHAKNPKEQNFRLGVAQAGPILSVPERE